MTKWREIVFIMARTFFFVTVTSGGHKQNSAKNTVHRIIYLTIQGRPRVTSVMSYGTHSQYECRL